MIINQFPDIDWLKNKIKSNFNDRKAVDDVTLKHPGWPTVILNAKTQFAERRDIKGPFSLFLNKTGSSRIGLEGRDFQINEDCFTFSNLNQHYDLMINELSSTETLNIHFGEHFYFEALRVLKSREGTLLDNPETIDKDPFNAMPRTMYRDDQFNALIDVVIQAHERKLGDTAKEESLFSLLEYLLTQNSRELKRIHGLKTKRHTTKLELIKRLYQARDFIHANLSKDITLDDLSKTCCLSKFHFLRLFKEVFRESPYQYIKRLRFEKALILIQKTDRPLEDIAALIGLDNGSSLSRMVFQQTTHYPSYFRI